MKAIARYFVYGIVTGLTVGIISYLGSCGGEEPESPPEPTTEAPTSEPVSEPEPDPEQENWHQRYVEDHCAKCPECCVDTSIPAHEAGVRDYVYYLANAMQEVQPRLELEDARRFAAAMILAALYEGVDVYELAAVGYVESRWTENVTGDQGRSCGMFQQQAKYSYGYTGNRSWLRDSGRTVADECAELQSVEYSAGVCARFIRRLRDRRKGICHYNQGNRCVDNETYTSRVESMTRRLRDLTPDGC